jgi:glycine cleavage system H lipoate-binding protein
MFPGVDGFHWTAGHIIFLTLFGLVAMTIGAAVMAAVWKTRRDLSTGHAPAVLWHAEFDDLPIEERRCRHELSGRTESRMCPNAFDCRHCEQYATLAALPTHAPDHAFGLDYPATRLYHRGHAWVERESGDTVRVGLDDLATRLVGKPDHVSLPEPGTRLRANGTGWRFKKNGHEIRILAPLDGEVIETGGYGDGWYLRLRVAAGEKQMRHLLRGAEVTGWLMRELERLQLGLAPGGAAPSLADGGMLADGLMDHVPQADWESVLGGTFLES